MLKFDIQLFGGRGSSSGISYKGHKYGTDYKTVLKSGNIKFIVKNRPDAEELLETMEKGRVYVLLNSKNNPGYIYYFNNQLKRNSRIDLSHYHRNMKPHNHHFEEKAFLNGKKGASKLTPQETKLVNNVLNIWYNKSE